MSALDRLAAIEELREPFATDPNAKPGTYEHRLHAARVALERYSGTGAADAGRFAFEKATALLSRVVTSLVWVVFGFIPELSVIVIAGEPKTSKTWLALTMAIATAARNALFGVFKVPSGARRAVCYFALEDSDRSFKTRLIALARGMGLDPVAAVEHVQVKCRSSLNLRSDADLCGLAASCPDDLAILFIDPLRDAHTGEENSSGDMAEVMRRLRFLRDFLGCSVVFVHHSAKASPDKANRRPGQMMRGSSAVHGAVDGGIYLLLQKASEAEWQNTVVVELKAGKGAGTFGLTLNIEDNENGEAQLARWTYSAVPTEKGREELDALADRVVEHLANAFKHNPQGRQGVSREVLRTNLGVGKAKASAAIDQAIQSGRARFAKGEGGVVLVAREEIPNAD